MKNPIIRKYYTYQELLNLVNIEDVSMPRFPHDVEMSVDWFTKLIEAGDLEFAVYTLSEFFLDDSINDIVNALMGIVYNRHAQDFIAMVEDSGDEGEDTEKAMNQALSKLINVIDLTLPKYVPILEQNEWASTCPITPNVDEVLEEVSGDNHLANEGQTRFNDTPQNSGNYADDPHTTNVTDNESTSDGDFASNTKRTNSTNIGTLMARLEEMYKNFRSIILEWSNEFNQLFLKEEQL